EGISVYCSGVNVFRFLPVTKGRHGLGSNPAMRGLQLVNLGVRDLALSRGVTMKAFRGNDCTGIAPTQGHWYGERFLIGNAPESFPEEVIQYGVINLVKKIFKATMLEVDLPGTLLAPNELQAFLETQCSTYGR
ncbi:MAG: hypothetical protein ACM34I_06660, partial [bacterium]